MGWGWGGDGVAALVGHDEEVLRALEKREPYRRLAAVAPVLNGEPRHLSAEGLHRLRDDERDRRRAEEDVKQDEGDVRPAPVTARAAIRR